VTAISPVEDRGVAERRRALRALLSRPLLLASRDPDAFAGVVRHRADLARWLSDATGWTLAVEAAAGHARLFKRPARRDASRPARAPGKGPFDRRRYALLCLALAALDDVPGQITLARLAESVRELSLEDPAVPPFDPDVQAERHAFVDVLRLLGDLGVLVLRDGDAERYVRAREGDALYDVRERLLGQLLAAPIPPALAGSPGRMAEEERARTEEGERIRARQTVFRALLDDPVVYLEDLDDRARDWLLHGSGHVYERLARDAGLVVERREEGLAAIDPDGGLSDSAFPEGSSTVKHAALLLCEWLADRARSARAASGDPGEGAVAWDEVLARTGALRAEHAGRWSREYEDGAPGTKRLARDAMAVLEDFGLAARCEGGFVARPTAARFSPAPVSG
jgi:uncharacterized protein (TIGR02678 family)